MTFEGWFAQLSKRDQKEILAMSEEEQAAMRAYFPTHVPPTDQLRALTNELFDRACAGDGRILRRHNFEGAQIHECFNNVEAWVKAHPGHSAVYGFLYYDFDLLLPHVRFVPHVAVETEKSGEWLDVTPHEVEGEYPLLQHIGTMQEFDAAMEHRPLDLIYR
jgi:hypothetical protein